MLYMKCVNVLFLTIFITFIGGANANLEWKRINPTDSDLKISKFANVSATNGDYIFGGIISGHYTNNLYFLKKGSFDWTQLNGDGPAPCRRAGMSLTKIGTALYVVGGHNDSGTLSNLYKYDIISNKWYTVYPLEDFNFKSRSGHSACTDGNNRIFLFGGYNDAGIFLNDLYEINFTIKSELEYNTTYVYAKFKLLNNKRNSLNPSPRESSSLVYSDGKLYLFGGYTYGASCSDGMWIFDLKESQWKKSLATIIPYSGEGFSCRRMGRAILYFGGCDYTYSSQRCYNDLWHYDTVEDKWTVIFTIEKPSHRGYSLMTLVDDSLLVYGGSKLDKIVYNDFWKLPLYTLPCQDPNYSCFGNGTCYGIICKCNSGFTDEDCGTIIPSNQEIIIEDTEKSTEDESHVTEFNYTSSATSICVALVLLLLAYKLLL